MENEVVVVSQNSMVETIQPTTNFGQMMELAEMLSKTTIIPANYQRNKENCFVAVDMANRMGVSPMFVMQNLYVVQGKPSWSGSAIASMIENCGKFKDVELVYVGKEGTDEWGAYVKAVKISSGKEIKGATVTIGTAKAEGWYQKAGSKWKSMPEIMLAYRAYAWFGRVHAPEIMMGLQTNDEVLDVTNQSSEVKNPYEK